MAFKDRFKALLKRTGLGPRRPEKWPFIPGRYYLVDDTAPVIVVMPDNDTLAHSLSSLSVQGLCLVSSICRSVSDVEKLTRNVEANLAVHCILLAGGGKEENYPAVEALRTLFDDDDGISDKARQIAHGVRGKLKAFDFAALQKRVSVVNMVDCAELDKIIAGVVLHGNEGQRPDAGFVVQGHETTLGVQRVIAPTRISHEYQNDKAGKFIIGTDRKFIVVEHYNSKGELLRLVQGTTARDVCIMLIRNGWVSRLDHAAFLGRELALAEIALAKGESYTMSGEPITDETAKPADDA